MSKWGSRCENVFDTANFNHAFDLTPDAPLTANDVFRVTSAYTDINTTYDPGGRLGQNPVAIELVGRDESPAGQGRRQKGERRRAMAHGASISSEAQLVREQTGGRARLY